MLKHLETNKNYQILDHGCGGAINVCYLLCLGYKNVKGVDVGRQDDRFSKINNFLIDNNISEGEVVFSYQGKHTDFSDHQFDVIFSTQVIEHLSDTDFHAFFQEEKRILDSKGVMFHEFPHKNTIRDGHLRTFLLHMLPDRILTPVLKLIGNKRYERINRDVFLRRVSKIKKNARQYFNVITDLTDERLLLATDYETYKGNKLLRRLVGYLLSVGIFRKFIANFAIKTMKFCNQ